MGLFSLFKKKPGQKADVYATQKTLDIPTVAWVAIWEVIDNEKSNW